MTPRLFATNRLCERKDKRISPSNESMIEDGNNDEHADVWTSFEQSVTYMKEVAAIYQETFRVAGGSNQHSVPATSRKTITKARLDEAQQQAREALELLASNVLNASTAIISTVEAQVFGWHPSVTFETESFPHRILCFPFLSPCAGGFSDCHERAVGWCQRPFTEGTTCKRAAKDRRVLFVATVRFSSKIAPWIQHCTANAPRQVVAKVYASSPAVSCKPCMSSFASHTHAGRCAFCAQRR